jgi:hypothetical protein
MSPQPTPTWRIPVPYRPERSEIAWICRRGVGCGSPTWPVSVTMGSSNCSRPLPRLPMRTDDVPLILVLLIAALVAVPAPAAEPPKSYDVVIYGGTSAGVIAAVQAKRMGKSAAIVAPETHLGGLTASGLGATDSGRKEAIGGLAREFYQRIRRHYESDEAWPIERRQDFEGFRPGEDAMWYFEPHVAEAVFEQLVKEHDLPVYRGERLDREAGVMKEGQRITSIATRAGHVYRARMFIDATYEGDLMAAAGVSYTVGRESNSQYGESLNGVQTALNLGNHRFLVPVDPYVRPGDPASGLVWGVHGDPPGEEGTGDHRVQAYCYRLCLTDAAANRVPHAKPADYDESRYELLLRNFEAGDYRFPLHNVSMPNRKTDTNTNGAVSTNAIGRNYEYAEASDEERDRILAEHRSYQQGLLWTLANHPRVPWIVRREMAKWGLAKDEFVDNGHWPYQIYVREARRMVSDYVQTEHDCRRTRVCDDSVGLGSYNMDSHNVQRYVTPNGTVQNEGDVQVSPGGSYAISFRAIMPKKGEAENLLVPVCVSASHIAYGSIRMEPVFMILGQSAATAAALAIDADTPIQDLPYAPLRQRLEADDQRLDPQGPPRPIRDGKTP